MSVGLCDVDAGADGGCNRLLNQVGPASPGLDARVHHGALLNLGNPRGDTDQQTGLEQRKGGYLFHKLLQHTLRHIVVGDHALPQGTHSHNIARGAAQHSLGLGAHLQQLAGILIHGHYRGFTQDNALALNIYQNRGSAQVNPDIFTKETHYLFHLKYLVIHFNRRRLAALKRHFLL